MKRASADSEFATFESFAEPEQTLSITLHVQARPWASTPLGVCLQQPISTPPSPASPYPLALHCISSSVLSRTSAPNCYSSAQSLAASSHLSQNNIQSPQGPMPVWSPPASLTSCLTLCSQTLFRSHWPPGHSSHRPSTFLPQDLTVSIWTLFLSCPVLASSLPSGLSPNISLR